MSDQFRLEADVETARELLADAIERQQNSNDEITRLRARETVLVGLLADAIELIERECGDPNSDGTLTGVNRINPDKFYDIAAMRDALATISEE